MKKGNWIIHAPPVPPHVLFSIHVCNKCISMSIRSKTSSKVMVSTWKVEQKLGNTSGWLTMFGDRWSLFHFLHFLYKAACVSDEWWLCAIKSAIRVFYISGEEHFCSNLETISGFDSSVQSKCDNPSESSPLLCANVIYKSPYGKYHLLHSTQFPLTLFLCPFEGQCKTNA